MAAPPHSLSPAEGGRPFPLPRYERRRRCQRWLVHLKLSGVHPSQLHRTWRWHTAALLSARTEGEVADLFVREGCIELSAELTIPHRCGSQQWQQRRSSNGGAGGSDSSGGPATAAPEPPPPSPLASEGGMEVADIVGALGLSEEPTDVVARALSFGARCVDVRPLLKVNRSAAAKPAVRRIECVPVIEVVRPRVTHLAPSLELEVTVSLDAGADPDALLELWARACGRFLPVTVAASHAPAPEAYARGHGSAAPPVPRAGTQQEQQQQQPEVITGAAAATAARQQLQHTLRIGGLDTLGEELEGDGVERLGGPASGCSGAMVTIGCSRGGVPGLPARLVLLRAAAAASELQRDMDEWPAGRCEELETLLLDLGAWAMNGAAPPATLRCPSASSADSFGLAAGSSNDDGRAVAAAPGAAAAALCARSEGPGSCSCGGRKDSGCGGAAAITTVAQCADRTGVEPAGRASLGPLEWCELGADLLQHALACGWLHTAAMLMRSLAAGAWSGLSRPPSGKVAGPWVTSSDVGGALLPPPCGGANAGVVVGRPALCAAALAPGDGCCCAINTTRTDTAAGCDGHGASSCSNDC